MKVVKSKEVMLAEILALVEAHKPKTENSLRDIDESLEELRIKSNMDKDDIKQTVYIILFFLLMIFMGFLGYLNGIN